MPAPAQAVKAETNASQQPFIPEQYVDAPSQRLYILSIGLLIQAIKVFDWLQSLIFSNSSTNLTFKWLLVDAVYLLTLKRLRIPRLNYAASVVCVQILLLWLFDGVLFGSVQIGVSRYSLTYTAREYYQNELSQGVQNLFGGDNLRGEHTVRMSPISTARLNPGSLSFCLGAPSNFVLVPILLNNTKPSHIRYSIRQLGSEKVENVDLNTRDLKAIESTRLESLQLTKTAAPQQAEEYNEDDWDEEDEEEAPPHTNLLGYSNYDLEETQGISHLKISKPGIIRLERVLDAPTSNLARVLPNEITIAPCPQASFVADKISNGDAIRCLGESEELSVKLVGVPPLSVKYFGETNGQREYFSVDQIEGKPGMEGQAQELRVPLDMSFDVAGIRQYTLHQVYDGLGNMRTLGSLPSTRSPDEKTPTPSEYTRSVTVLRRAGVSFKDCGPGKPSSLLIGSEAHLQLASRDTDPKDSPLAVTIAYRPPSTNTTAKNAVSPWRKVISYPSGRSSFPINVTAPGEYSVVGVKGQTCPGDVLSPDTCKVVEEPHPSAEIELKRIHECSGDTGVSAYLVMQGKPPFQVHYKQKRNDEAEKEMSRVFQGSRGDITLQPENSGRYSYWFTHLSDANYKRIKLDGPSISQTVHPLASASFVFHGATGTGNRRAINSCSGNTVDVEVDFRGDSPWNLELQVSGPNGVDTIHLPGLQKSRERIKVPIPRSIDDEGGSFQIDLVSVEDVHGCKKALAVPGMSVNVRRVKPSARFYSQTGQRTTTVLEGKSVQLPLRLSGDGPWRIKYQRTDPADLPRTTMIHSPNDHLSIDKKGVYKLLEVSDSQCPGVVDEEASEYTVDWIPRPSITLSQDSVVTYDGYNGSFIRAPICEGSDDFVDLDMTGRPPFQILYNVARESEVGGTRILDQPVISSVQSRTRLQLLTSQAGRIFYEIKQIGDANYPLAQNKDHVIPRNDRLLFEQSVIGRASAQFKKSARLSHCLRDTFVPSDPLSSDDIILLDGQPPFSLDLSIKSLATSHIHRETVEIREAQWKVNLPKYIFTSIGPHQVTIEAVRDASSCKQSVTDPLRKSIWVDVAESAAIVPYDRREHFCVGDVAQFQMEGSPPWTVGYKVNKKYHEQVAKSSPFILTPQQPGNVSIVSVSHQHKMCRSTVENIEFQVHALPSAQIANGRDYFEDIHEGTYQAHIVFTLEGEPPFTFTYQRSEAPARRGGKPGKVLESHTVSGVMEHEYSIYTALEGTWTVTFISDKYCRYPPVSPEGSGERSK
ncbi:hypothetical protein SCHPADRAFT_863370 [Schizopora paradoxa]|uniref:Nucleoporin Pom152 n=1 Tax=Schizopora paradoxa TaxID=27342 RepID=A0A0H2S8I5_9AGAM|nr:hypothetical protein SCHPADRAFT_863370 [Schizopora paradoxa]